MQRLGWFAGLVWIATIAVGCGGAKTGAKGAEVGPASESTAAAFSDRSDNGQGAMPGWVSKGSAAVTTDDGRRVFYGVGVASNIRNVSLLRSTADNRARNELAKVLEVYSASLMKDYMASQSGAAGSSEQQSVEQAIKTGTSMSLKGTEIVDRYFAQDGSIYALAQLDVEKMMEAIKKASESGAFTSYVEKVTVDDIFDKNSKKSDPPPAPPKVASNDSTPAPKQRAESKSDVPKATGKPDWVDGEDPRFSRTEYLCGVGFGPTRSHAENGAYAAVSRIFVANVQSVSQDFMGAYSSTGAQDLNVQWSEQLTQVATDKVLSGVTLMEIWESGSDIYGLACLDRAQAAATLQQQIRDLDGQTESFMARAMKGDKTTKFQQLAKALGAILNREALNAELRIVNYSGTGIAGPYSHADVAAAFSAAQEALRVGLKADGPYADDFLGIFMERLTQKGYKVEQVSDGGGGMDVVVDARIEFDDLGKLDGRMYFARGNITIKLVNGNDGRVFGTVNESRKEGRATKRDAERFVVMNFGRKLSGKVANKIDKAMKGN